MINRHGLHIAGVTILVSFIAGVFGRAENSDSPDTGAANTVKYLGLEPPAEVPEVFAPGLISTEDMAHSSPSFSPDGLEVLWTVIKLPLGDRNPHFFMHMRWSDSGWSAPVRPPFLPEFGDGPCFSPDGSRLYFSSGRNGGRADILFIEKSGTVWSEPRGLPSPVNTDSLFEAQPCPVADGSLYFLRETRTPPSGGFDIYCSRYINGAYTDPYALDSGINALGSHDWTPYVAPDERFLLFSSDRAGDPGKGDLYVSYRSGSGQWSEPLNLGAPINTADQERFPRLSPDGDYLFFCRDEKVYWVSALFIERLRPDSSVSE